MNLQKLYKAISIWLWTGIVSMLVVLSLYVSMGRHYLPQLGAYQSQLVSEIEARIGTKLTIGSLDGFWSQLSPGIILSDVNLYSFTDADLPGISFDKLEASVNFFSSLIALRPLLDTLIITSPDIHFYQTDSGHWLLADFTSDNVESNTSAMATIEQLLEAASYIQIENAEIYFHPKDRPDWAVGGLNIDLYRGVGVNLAKVLIKDIAGNIVLDFDAQSKGSFGDNDFRVKAHGMMSQFNIIPLLTLGGVKNIGASGLNGDVWFNWDSSKGGSLQGSLAADNFRVSSGPFNNATKLSDLKTSYLIDMDLDFNVKAWINDLSAQWKNSVYSLADFKAEHIANKEFSFSMREANVTRLLTLARRVVKLPEKLSTVLATIGPTGMLQNINITKSNEVPIVDGLKFSAKVENLNTRAWNGAPGVENLSGYLTGEALKGRFDIDAEDMSLSFPGIYKNKIATTQLLGSIAWHVGDDKVTVNSGPLTVMGDFGNGKAQLDLAIPLQEADDTYPHMSLLIGVKDFDTKYRNQVIPLVVGQPLIEWLDQSILAGKASEVGFIYYGSLLKKDVGRQVVQVELDVVDAALKYDPAWPIAENINAKVIVSNNITHGYVKSASVYNSVLDNLNVELMPKDEIFELEVSSDIKGPAADILTLFKETSLKDIFGSNIDGWQSTGSYSANISFAMPLVSESVPVIKVGGELYGVGLEKSDANFQLTELYGDISYTTWNGLAAKKLAGIIWKKKFNADIKTSDKKTIVNINGAIEIAEVQKWLQQPILGFADGTAQVEGELIIANTENGGVELVIRSLLEGVIIDLPKPFFKARQESMIFKARVGLAGSNYPVTLTIGDLAKVSLLSGSKDEKFKAIVVVGEKNLTALPDAGLALTGAVNKVSLEDWLLVIDRYERFAKEVKPFEKEAANSSSSPMFIDGLEIGELDAFGQIINNSIVDLQFIDGRWAANLKHERLRGSILLPSETDQLELNLDYIHLPLNADEFNEVGSSDLLVKKPLGIDIDALGNVDPSQYIPISVVSRSTFINNANLGSWAFNFRPSHSGAVISGIKADINGLRLSGFDSEQGGDLVWSVNNGVMTSDFSGIFEADNIGELFEAQGIAQPIISDRARFIANVNWPGSPAAIALKRVNGDIQIDMHDGQFLQTTGTATGALKLLGVLNFNNLVRRLQLDFSDLYKKGLSYKSVNGIMVFNNGTLEIEEPLHVRGPSSDFKMTGNLDLDQETIAGELVITLPISANLPWIVALVGGVPAAAGTYLASLIFKDQLNKLTSAVYKISGKWSEPAIIFDRLFDTDKKKQ